MNTVTIDKERLRTTLEENLAKHETEYAETYAGWQEAVLTELRRLAREFKKDPKGTRLYVNLPAPENHAHDYRETLSMLEWEQKDSVELDREDFARYVNDEWEWKDRFLTASATYNNR